MKLKCKCTHSGQSVVTTDRIYDVYDTKGRLKSNFIKDIEYVYIRDDYVHRYGVNLDNSVNVSFFELVCV